LQLYCAEYNKITNGLLSSNNIGSGIGTGPGVIQDRFSPTMGRHRSNQLFNGHGGHLMPSAQPQFGELGKSFLKNQVRKEWLEHVKKLFYRCICYGLYYISVGRLCQV